MFSAYNLESAYLVNTKPNTCNTLQPPGNLEMEDPGVEKPLPGDVKSCSLLGSPLAPPVHAYFRMSLCNAFLKKIGHGKIRRIQSELTGS